MRISEILKSTAYDTDITVKGWVRTKRENKYVVFISLNDGSCVSGIQIVADPQKIAEEDLKKITTGACLCVNGKLVQSPGSGQGVEVQASEIIIYGTADPETYPLQKRVTPWSSFVISLTSVPVQILSVRFCASVTQWHSLFTSISTITDSTICTHL